MGKDPGIWFDEEGDFPEFRIGEPKKGFFKEVAPDVSERVDKQGNILGFALFNFIKQEHILRKIKLPVRIMLVPARQKRKSAQ